MPSPSLNNVNESYLYSKVFFIFSDYNPRIVCSVKMVLRGSPTNDRPALRVWKEGHGAHLFYKDYILESIKTLIFKIYNYMYYATVLVVAGKLLEMCLKKEKRIFKF